MADSANRLGDFLAGVQVTFGIYAKSAEELAAFLRAAEAFYLDYCGASPHAKSISQEQALPFWRYLLHYATVALDQAATDALIDSGQQNVIRHQDIAAELSACWPFMGVLASGVYTSASSLSSHTASPATASTSTAAGKRQIPGQSSPLRSTRTDAGVQTEREAVALPRIVEVPLVPPVQHSFAQSVEPTPQPAHFSSFSTYAAPSQYDIGIAGVDNSNAPESFSTRSAGRTLSASTDATDSSISTAQSDSLLATPPQTSAEPTFQIAGDSMPLSRGGSAISTTPPEGRSPNSTPKAHTPNPYFAQAAIPSTKLILADRGDNAARLVPMPDGAYVLDISIGGRKLLVKPENPTEILYHDQRGSVVTQSLLPARPSQIPAA